MPVRDKIYTSNVTTTIRMPAELVDWIESKIGPNESRSVVVVRCVARAKADEEADRITLPELLETLRACVKAIQQGRHLVAQLIDRRRPARS
jgi:hypothetical protein